MTTKRIAVLISGRGSNLLAMLGAMRSGTLGGDIMLVVSSKPGVPGLTAAQAHAVATAVVEPRAFATRAAFDDALAAVIDREQPDVIVLAGFMRVLGAAFVRRYEGRLINVHPSLLPAYPGLDTHRRALADGVRIHGCTVHFVTPEVDVGPIIAQGAIAVHPDEDEASLAARVLEVEHTLLPAAVRRFCTGALVIEGNRVRVKDMADRGPTAALLMPPT